MEYINYLKRNKYSLNTINTYKSILNLYKDDFGDIRMIKKRLSSYFDKPNTAWTHYNVLLSYMKFLKDGRAVSLKQIKIPPIPTVYRDIFTKSFLYKKTEDQNVQKNVVIRFLFETGIRAGELSTIKNISKDTLLVYGKGKKEREIFHNIETTKRLSPFKFTTKTLRIWVKEVLGEQYTPHSIRRSHATHMLIKGANPKSVMLQLGHSKVETTYKYLQLSKETNKKIYNKYF